MKNLEYKLNEIIDNEFKKNNPDCDLISESVDSLLRLENTEKYIITKDEMNKRILKILSVKSEKSKHKKLLRVLLIAAVIISILVIVTIAYSGIKYNVKNIGDMSNIKFSFTQNKKVKELTVDYLPDGYYIFEKQEDTFGFSYTYTNAENIIINIGKSITDDIDVNTEYEDISTVKIDGTEYILYGEPVHGQGIIWVKDGYLYDITSELPKDELIKIAQGVS